MDFGGRCEFITQDTPVGLMLVCFVVVIILAIVAIVWIVNWWRTKRKHAGFGGADEVKTFSMISRQIDAMIEQFDRYRSLRSRDIQELYKILTAHGFSSQAELYRKKLFGIVDVDKECFGVTRDAKLQLVLEEINETFEREAVFRLHKKNQSRIYGEQQENSLRDSVAAGLDVDN